MSEIIDFLSRPWWILVLGPVLAVLAVYSIKTRQQLQQFRGLFENFADIDKTSSAQQVMGQILSKMDQLSFNINQLGGIQHQISDKLRLSVQKKAMIRFNPFEDAGGDQSFAIALLDEQDNGLIISSLHARDGTRVYAKPIQGGKSQYPLAEEEKEVLLKAMRE